MTTASQHGTTRPTMADARDDQPVQSASASDSRRAELDPAAVAVVGAKRGRDDRVSEAMRRESVEGRGAGHGGRVLGILALAGISLVAFLVLVVLAAVAVMAGETGAGVTAVLGVSIVGFAATLPLLGAAAMRAKERYRAAKRVV